MYPGHETIWYHRRDIFQLWLSMVTHYDVSQIVQNEFFDWKINSEDREEEFDLDKHISPSLEIIKDHEFAKIPSIR